MNARTDDLRIKEIRELVTPHQVMSEHPLTDTAPRLPSSRAAERCRTSCTAAATGWPSSSGRARFTITKAAMEYAHRLRNSGSASRVNWKSSCACILRSRAPRLGWKGLINDPDLDGSFNINRGLRIARQLLVDINDLGLPAGCEFLDIITPQYIGDLVTWGAIGARTTESQVHREMTSGLSCPVGFKNGTDGNVKIAIDAVQAASFPHHFLAVTKQGHSAIATTSGNGDCHVILRGGKEPNYDSASIDSVVQNNSAAAKLSPRVMVDVSHGNSSKKPENQPLVIADIAKRIQAGERRISGVMVESHLKAGRQDLVTGKPLEYGQSIQGRLRRLAGLVQVLEQLARAVVRVAPSGNLHRVELSSTRCRVQSGLPIITRFEGRSRLAVAEHSRLEDADHLDLL